MAQEPAAIIEVASMMHDYGVFDYIYEPPQELKQINPLATTTLAQGIDLLQHIGMEQIALHLQELSHYLLTRLKQIHAIEFLPGFGRCEEWCSPGYGILSFRLPGVSAEECAMLLAENALLVDLADIPQYPDAITVSLHLYNTLEHVDALVECLGQLCV